jgi:hypothetical protein
MQLTRLLYTLAFALGFAAVACGGPDTTTPEDPSGLEQEATTEGDVIETSDDALRPRPPAPGGGSCSGTGGTCCNKVGSCWTGPSCSISCPSGQNAQCTNGYCSGRVALGGTCGCFGI